MVEEVMSEGSQVVFETDWETNKIKLEIKNYQIYSFIKNY